MRLVLFCCVILVGHVMCGQSRLMGSKMLGVQTGISGNGYYGAASFDAAWKRKVDVGGLMGYELVDQNGIEMRSVFMDVHGKLYIVSAKGFRLYGKGGISFCNDAVVNNELLDETGSKFGFNYGAGAGYWFDKVWVGTEFAQKTFTSNVFGKNRYLLGLQVSIVL